VSITTEQVNERLPIKVAYGMLGGWICVPADMTEAEIATAIEMLQSNWNFPVVPAELVRDRLYGGFACEVPERRHVYVAMCEYTYLGENGPNHCREDTWATLIEENGFVEGGPFTEDAPEVPA